MKGTPQQQVVAYPARCSAPPPGLCQEGLALMERQAFDQDAIVTSLDQCDQAGLRRHALFSREVRRMAGAAKQALHPARPVLFLDFDQRL